MASEMVERVAIAVAKLCAVYSSPINETVKVTAGDIARAAIEAMRKPTGAMYEVGKFRMISMPLGNGQEIQVPGLAESPGAVWERMIDAALAE